MKWYSWQLLFLIHSVTLLPSSEITLGFIGDIMLGRNVGDYVRGQADDSFVWSDVVQTLNQTDFNVANLETTFTTSTNKEPKVFNFKSDPSNVRFLKSANIQVVNLANNHSLDFGVVGLLDTIITLLRAKINFMGAGLNLKEAQKPVIMNHKGLTLAFIGATDNEPTWKADDQKPGTNYIAINQQSLSQLKKQISALKKEVDIVIVSLHWGGNWASEPPQEFRNFAHGLIDAGAHIIHGHSAHIPQGIELYNNKIIIYSAGDFLDDYAIDPVLRNDQSFLFLVTLNKHDIKKVQLIPVIIDSMQVRQVKGARAQSMIKHMQNLSQKLGTSISSQGEWQ